MISTPEQAALGMTMFNDELEALRLTRLICRMRHGGLYRVLASAMLILSGITVITITAFEIGSMPAWLIGAGLVFVVFLGGIGEAIGRRFEQGAASDPEVGLGRAILRAREGDDSEIMYLVQHDAEFAKARLRWLARYSSNGSIAALTARLFQQVHNTN